jgi:hypothetical protein
MGHSGRVTDTPWPQDPISYLPPGFAPDEGKRWAEKHWLNVPGPIYTGQTDTCWTGRQHAPRHVLYGGEYYNEFIFRQPKTRAEVEAVTAAALADPFDAYDFDGDARWTPEAVRAWWSERHRVVEHVMALIPELTAADAVPEMLEAAEGVRDFLAYIRGEIETDLRAYIFRLEQGHYPMPGDQLPDL